MSNRDQEQNTGDDNYFVKYIEQTEHSRGTEGTYISSVRCQSHLFVSAFWRVETKTSSSYVREEEESHCNFLRERQLEVTVIPQASRVSAYRVYQGSIREADPLGGWTDGRIDR